MVKKLLNEPGRELFEYFYINALVCNCLYLEYCILQIKGKNKILSPEVKQKKKTNKTKQKQNKKQKTKNKNKNKKPLFMKYILIDFCNAFCIIIIG